MTNEEAKDVLIEYRSDPKSKDWILKSKFPLALDVAIQALSDGWIRVEDKMPNYLENRDVITYSEKSYSKIDIQTVYRPAPISEEEIRKQFPTTIADLGRKPTEQEDDGHGLFWENSYKQEGARWTLSKQSRIVLPELKTMPKLNDTEYTERKTWNACLESIRTLNPSAVFVTGQNEAK